MARLQYDTSINSEFNIYTWHVINKINLPFAVPKQTDGSSCGIFLVMSAYSWYMFRLCRYSTHRTYRDQREQWWHNFWWELTGGQWLHPLKILPILLVIQPLQSIRWFLYHPVWTQAMNYCTHHNRRESQLHILGRRGTSAQKIKTDSRFSIFRWEQ